MCEHVDIPCRSLRQKWVIPNGQQEMELRPAPIVFLETPSLCPHLQRMFLSKANSHFPTFTAPITEGTSQPLGGGPADPGSHLGCSLWTLVRTQTSLRGVQRREGHGWDISGGQGALGQG